MINAVVKRDCAYLLTDTAAYDRGAVVRAFVSKTMVIPHLRMAISMRGPYAVVALATGEIGVEFGSFDAFVRDAKDFLSDFHDEHHGVFAAAGESEFDFVTVGWSDRANAPAAYAISSVDYSAHGGAEPLTMARHSLLLAPAPGKDALRAAGLDSGRLMSGAPLDGLLAVAEAQRRQKWPVGSGATLEGHIIGGSALLTTVDADGVSQRIVRRWNDVVDELITPDRETAPATVAALPARHTRIGGIFGGAQ